MGIKVVATKRGYYGQLIEPGQMFEIAKKEDFADSSKTGGWMKLFDVKNAKGVQAAPKPRNRRESKVIEPETLKDAGELMTEGEDLNDWQE